MPDYLTNTPSIDFHRNPLHRLKGGSSGSHFKVSMFYPQGVIPNTVFRKVYLQREHESQEAGQAVNYPGHFTMKERLAAGRKLPRSLHNERKACSRPQITQVMLTSEEWSRLQITHSILPES